MVSSRNDVCIWWIQESLFLKLEALRMWVPDSSLKRIHDEIMASIGSQELINRMEISEWKQTEMKTA